MSLAFILTLTTRAQEQSGTQEAAISVESQMCISCHETYTPGIVEDWRQSRHAVTTPTMGQAKTELERRISSPEVPAGLRDVVVGCYECHGLRTSMHKDTFEHFGSSINVVVSPADCKTCHTTEAEQFAGTKKAHALDNLEKNPVYRTLVETITGMPHGGAGKVTSSDDAKNETCYACHGTRVEVRGTRTLQTDLGEVAVPVLSNWPNQGVGRINPDGSQGACTACHPRHSFLLAIARKPYTCGQCHLEPDVPAFNVYKESKHGNIFDSYGEKWEWETVPWTVGKDFKAPTCAACHNSLVVSSTGTVVTQRSHDFGARLWVRIFGLTYSHPQPKSGATYTIKNSDGLPLPTTFGNVPASGYLLSREEQQQRKSVMKGGCLACHGASWVDQQIAKIDSTNHEADQMVLAATQVLSGAWKANLADQKNPFDESLEKRWVVQWLFYANSVRYATAMIGPDYAAFKNGWWDLARNLELMKTMVRDTK
jgi:hydroxylamine dehydrogenase